MTHDYNVGYFVPHRNQYVDPDRLCGQDQQFTDDFGSDDKHTAVLAHILSCMFVSTPGQVWCGVTQTSNGARQSMLALYSMFMFEISDGGCNDDDIRVEMSGDNTILVFTQPDQPPAKIKFIPLHMLETHTRGIVWQDVYNVDVDAHTEAEYQREHPGVLDGLESRIIGNIC